MSSFPVNRVSKEPSLARSMAGLFLSFVAFAAALILGPSNLRAQQAGNVQNGKLIFSSQKCEGCHGSEGQGGNGQTAGPQIGPPSLALAMFVTVVRNPKDPMPPYSTKDVTDAQLADVYAFLRSVTPSAQAGAAPTGNVDNGRQLYTRVGCYECHNRDAEGAGTGPKLAPNPLPYAAFSHQVRSPVNSMPPYTSKVLLDAELADIYAFLQTLPKPPSLDSIPLLK